VTRLPLCGTKSQSVFETSVRFIEKQILYFLIQNWQSGHGSDTDQYVVSPCTLVCKSMLLLFKYLLQGKLVKFPPSEFPIKILLVYSCTPPVFGVRIFIIFYFIIIVIVNKAIP